MSWFNFGKKEEPKANVHLADTDTLVRELNRRGYTLTLRQLREEKK